MNAKRRHAQKMLHYVDMEISKIVNKPTTLFDSLRRQGENPSQIYRQDSDVEQRLKKCKNGDASVKAIAEILGVGLLTTTAAVATMGEAKAFKPGCDSADFIGDRSNKAVIEPHPPAR